MLLNVALAASLLWSEWLTPGERFLLWTAVGALWIGSAAFTRLSVRRKAARSAATSGDDYAEALDHYVKGHWFEAERALAKLLRREPRDLEARLLLATLLRRRGRIEESAEQLDRLERCEGSCRWALEIGRERQRLATARSQGGPPDPMETGSEVSAVAGREAA